jgi:hypothetical protein
LRRELGKWDLTAIGVNQVIGGAVFLMPALLVAQIGAWSAIAVALVGVLALLIALNFAEAGSRFDGTGGAYLYTRAAFGRFVSFEVGWMLWVTRVTSWASVVNGLTDALGYYWPELRAGEPGMAREIVISAVILSIMSINVLGIKQSAWVVNALTIGKLTPLVIFILLELPHLVEQHGMAQVQVGCGGVEAGLDDQRLATPQLADQIGLGEEVLRTAGDLRELRGELAGELRRAFLICHVERRRIAQGPRAVRRRSARIRVPAGCLAGIINIVSHNIM